MNYIHNLKCDNAGHIASIESFKADFHAFKCYLHSEKFLIGADSDWIGVNDVLLWLEQTLQNSLHCGNDAIKAAKDKIESRKISTPIER